MRRLLFVDDEPRVLDGLQRMLRAQRHRWDMVFAPGGAEAIQALDQAPFDVVVTDMRMPGIDGSKVLTEVARRSPDTVRIILSGQTEPDSAFHLLPLAHQFLMKPCDANTLTQAVERCCALRDLLQSEALRKLIGNIGAIPVVPTVYAELVRAVENPATSVTVITKIVERDGALASKVLQSVNSSFFGFGRPVTSISHAVSLLGVRLLRSLVLSQEIFKPFASGGPSAFDPEREHEHALLVARVARLVLGKGAMSEEASIAGLLHDVGKLLVYSQLPDPMREAAELSATAPCAAHEAERRVMGVSHAEIGAYLLGLWGLPHVVVEAVAYHHSPDQVLQRELDPVVAVYLADLAVNQIRAERTDRAAEVAVVATDPRLAEPWRVAAEASQDNQ